MNSDIGKLILRITLGVLILLHGISKVTHGIGSIQGMLTAHHLPAFVAWGVYAGEVAAPLMIILGVYTRFGAALILINMLFAIFLAHSGELLQLGKHGGWALELQGMFLLTALALMFLGPGKFKLHS
jgi:putative oxidoreductase